MHSTIVAAWTWSVVTIFSATAILGCGGPPPTEQGSPANASGQRPPSASESVTTPAPLARASRAPGTDRLEPDPHPELAHLTQVTTDSLAGSIATYVKTESDRHNGVFPVDDAAQRTSLALTLVTVHRERLSQLADGRYFACADFKGADGHTYDVDLFMRRESTGLVPTELIVHKQDGTPRFDWVERNGVWSQAPVAKKRPF